MWKLTRFCRVDSDAGGVIEMSEFSLFIRNQAKEAERKLKVCL
jgi:hypothetical protein